MRTRPRPRVGEAATVLPLLRYIPLRNQSRLIRWRPVEGCLVRVPHVHAGSALPTHHFSHMVQDRLVTQGLVGVRLGLVSLLLVERLLPGCHFACMLEGFHSFRGAPHEPLQPVESLQQSPEVPLSWGRGMLAGAVPLQVGKFVVPLPLRGGVRTGPRPSRPGFPADGLPQERGGAAAAGFLQAGRIRRRREGYDPTGGFPRSERQEFSHRGRRAVGMGSLASLLVSGVRAGFDSSQGW